MNVCLVPLAAALASMLIAGSAHAQDPPTALPPAPPPRVHLIPYIDIGFGLPTGMLGLSLAARYGPVAVEAGAGISGGGWQGCAQLWGHLFPSESVGDLALGIGYSTGDVASRGDLGGLFGPDTRYEPAHWLNLLVAPAVKLMQGGTGAVVRAHLGAMINLAPHANDSARVLPMFGLSIGWDVAL